MITAASSADRDGDGRLDTVVATFSEAVSHPADADGSYPLEVPGYGLTGVSAASGPTLEVSLQQTTDPDSGVKPNLRYVRGAGAPVVDLAGNEALENTFGSTSDGAPPRLLGATTLDTDEDGILDRLRFRFSEPVLHVLGSGAFSAQGLTALAPLPADGSKVEVNLQEGAGTNTGLLPLAFYVPPGPGGVSDLAGNLAPTGSVAASDGAGPVVVDASTGDADSDSRIDRVHVTMSEPVAYAGDSAAPFAVGAAGYTVASVDAATGSSFTIRLVEPSAPRYGRSPRGLLRDRRLAGGPERGRGRRPCVPRQDARHAAARLRGRRDGGLGRQRPPGSRRPALQRGRTGRIQLSPLHGAGTHDQRHRLLGLACPDRDRRGRGARHRGPAFGELLAAGRSGRAGQGRARGRRRHRRGGSRPVPRPGGRPGSARGRRCPDGRRGGTGEREDRPSLA